MGGKLHVVPDCLSRRSDSPIASSAPSIKDMDIHDISNVLPEYQNSLSAPSWVAPPPGGARPSKVAALLGEMCPVGQDNDIVTDSVLGILSGQGTSTLAGVSADTWFTSALINSSQSDIEVITWEKLAHAASSSPTYKSLHSLITSGAPEDKNLWPEKLQVYYPHRHALVPIGPVLMLHDRPLIPVDLRPQILEHLHAGHAGVTGMFARASNSFYWPGMKSDLIRHRAECISCVTNAPSNPSSPPLAYQHPSYPFHSVCSDFFSVNNISYNAIVDRYSGWLSLFSLAKDDSAHVINVLRSYFCRWGIPVELTTDGASVFVSYEMEQFLLRYGVKHRVSSAYYPRGNKRSEVAVKSGKRLIMDNLASNGSLDTDKFARALLMHRNQTDPVSGLSPAQVIFGRQLRDHLPLQPEKFQPRAEWRLEADQREQAFRKRHLLKHEQLSATSKSLPPLSIGDSVAVQDKTNSGKAGKWNKTGIITDSLGFQSYEVRIDGSNTLTTRHRSHLRKIVPFINTQMQEDQTYALPYQAPVTRSKSEIRSPGHSCVPDAILQKNLLHQHDLTEQERVASPAVSSQAPSLGPLSQASPTVSVEPLIQAPSPVPSQAPHTVAVPTAQVTRSSQHNPKPKWRSGPLVKERWIVREDWIPSSAVSTVQAILVTYPVSGSEGRASLGPNRSCDLVP